jgi:hypothetical protein
VKEGSLPAAALVFSTVPSAHPEEGPATGGTSVTLTSTNFLSNPQMQFGAGNPVNATAARTTQLPVSSPATAFSGPTNLSAFFANGWIALAPSAFAYGPSIVRVFPNAGTPQGGDTVTILGYGFGSSSSITVAIGGNNASVQSVQVLPVFAAKFGFDTTYPFALESITLNHAAGNSGQSRSDYSILRRDRNSG